MELTIAGVIKESIVDGPGIRYTVFTQGCPHHCPGCHNPQTWAFEGGQKTTPQELFADFQKDPILKGVTFSGGEPFCQAEALAELARLVHGAGKDVACYTGWTYEQLLEKDDPAVNALLAQVDRRCGSCWSYAMCSSTGPLCWRSATWSCASEAARTSASST